MFVHRERRVEDPLPETQGSASQASANFSAELSGSDQLNSVSY